MALTARAALFGLLLLLPFEPRTPVLVLPGARLTLLEAAAAVACVALALEARGRLAGLARRPPLPLFALGLYSAAHLLSAASCADHRDLALKFALRMAAMAAFALVVAAQPPDAIRAGLLGLVSAAALVALLAVTEGLGARFLDPFLAAFREAPFNVAGVRRASAGTEYPNLAAAFLMYGIVASAGLLSVRSRAWLRASALAALLSLGLLFTYSRGALVATALGLLVIAAGRRSGAAPLAALAALGLVTVGFVASGEAFRLRLGSEGIAGWYRARYEPAEREMTLAPGERRATRVTVTNTGSKAWVVSEGFHLACHWYDGERRLHRWDGGRTLLPRDLGPGQSLTLSAEVQAPASEGRFLLAWDMVHEHTTWFSEEGVPPAAVTVRVSRDAAAPPPAALSPPRVEDGPWRPSRFELWGVAMDLWRERPILGVGPDNFRRLYGPRAGHLSWDSRVYANNTLLEAAATTGLVGAACLAACLAAMLAWSWRRLRDAATGSPAQGLAAALLGLSAGIAAQGLVDYILAFTGHYLLFGFVVGAVSAAGYEARGRPVGGR